MINLIRNSFYNKPRVGFHAKMLGGLKECGVVRSTQVDGYCMVASSIVRLLCWCLELADMLLHGAFWTVIVRLWGKELGGERSCEIRLAGVRDLVVWEHYKLYWFATDRSILIYNSFFSPTPFPKTALRSLNSAKNSFAQLCFGEAR
jgi:hypothetical protein